MRETSMGTSANAGKPKMQLMNYSDELSVDKSERKALEGLPVMRPHIHEIYLQGSIKSQQYIQEKNPVIPAEPGKNTIFKYARAFCSSEQGLPSGKIVYQSLTYRSFIRAQLA